MGSTERPRSVVHNNAYHALLGWNVGLHPHLGTARRVEGSDQVCVDLLQPMIWPEMEPMSIRCLRGMFRHWLELESWQKGDLDSATVTFVYRGQKMWPDACYARIERKTRRVVEDAVGADGRRAEISRS